MLNESGGGPWGGRGGGSGGSGGDGGDGLGPRNPWQQPPRKRPSSGGGQRFGPSALDELIRRGRARFGGGFPNPQGHSIWLWAIGLFVLAWIALTSMHIVAPQQRGVITRFGKYAGTLGPGVGLTFPAPIDKVQKVDVDHIHTIDIDTGSGSGQNLVLTGDQNIVDLAYSVRWSIREPELYLFELADPDDTIKEVAESAMRAQLARVSLNDAIGPRRSEIEARVAQSMQALLDSYRAGVTIQGVAIKQADPPAEVVDAFKAVSAAQQKKQSYLNDARAYALQLTAKAQGEAAAFDKVYAEYRLAPEVTRRRMYYETMEKVLAKTDKTVIEAPGVMPYIQLPRGARPLPPPATTQATEGGK
ncbi:MAG TPA: FtsH protease activity modulator HflK [Sphingomonadaceae bacterium]|nr:FtsH protease activity modulator HflK [Sphingomonadaceae bacterium]